MEYPNYHQDVDRLIDRNLILREKPEERVRDRKNKE